MMSLVAHYEETHHNLQNIISQLKEEHSAEA